ncbi:AraC family transcriptional regulator [Paenibacillus sp. 7541]|uniref:AraC family transcriptional regulator n=2 Tax=Paenibacillus TaxID=44249 RepID=A0A268F4W2_9BACL|nr:helix-turn-helix domain-containing protein [Paenibacillus campinasensis]PAD80413.1 AraC family transcriptional regulator [Paenibacillus campinasensis]PAK55543.1 AraC family transcriptional regulator [Paenibacillus sp. 7541]
MILFGCVISIIPLIALGFFSFMKSSASVQSHVNSSNIQLMNQTNSNLEQVLKTVDYTLNYVINSNILQEALYRPLSYYDFQLYNKLREELSLLQSPETKVTDVILANATMNWLVNNRGMYDFYEYASSDTLLSLMELKSNSNWLLLETESLGSSDTQSYACPYTITLAKKMPLSSSEARGIAVATIPSCSLAAMMDSPSDTREVMVLDHDYRIVVHPEPGKLGRYLTDTGYEQEDLERFDSKSGQFETRIDGKPVSITYVRSDFNGWLYASLTEMAAVTKESRSIGWFTLYICLVMIGFSLLVVWLGTRRMYTPIRHIFESIVERLPEIQANKKNELQIIDEHIRDMFQSNTQLRNELRQHSQQVRTFFLHKLFLGKINAPEAEEQIELFGYRELVSKWERMAVFTLQIDMLDETRYERKDSDLLLFAIHNMIEEIIPSEHRLPSVIIDQTQVTLIGRGEITLEQFNDYIYKLSEEIQKTTRSFLDLDVSIGISLPYSNLFKTARAYQEGLEALKHRIKLGTGVIIPYHSLNSGKHTRVYFYPTQVENELIDAIKLADEERALELLGQWLSDVFHKDRTPHEYQISLIRLLNDLMIVMQESGIMLEQVHIQDGSLVEELLKLYTSSDIERWFHTRVIQPMVKVFRDRQQSQYQNLSEQMIEMIRNEFDRNITLEECASRLHYNNFYLSSVFKKETNMSFSEYLTQYRFKMSKKWLVETDMPIKEIAEKLSYNNSQNFIRSFRKLEGMTPGQYRSKYRQEG